MENIYNQTSIFIVKVSDNGEVYTYEYGNINHARIAYDREVNAQLLEYVNGNYYLMDAK